MSILQLSRSTSTSTRRGSKSESKSESKSGSKSESKSESENSNLNDSNDIPAIQQLSLSTMITVDLYGPHCSAVPLFPAHSQSFLSLPCSVVTSIAWSKGVLLVLHKSCMDADNIDTVDLTVVIPVPVPVPVHVPVPGSLSSYSETTSRGHNRITGLTGPGPVQWSIIQCNTRASR